ncbi:carboxypeptidase-like regulatory domain-containing protein [Paraburkholderia sp.]|uniref:carboxypeptidase-like regulatory domain-containing protein n=1 Tax=Paraburkholderia sp. TaxID=1926495 RepID=UPI00239782EE|nr:carboxypeptidase-like regulatory domain-containing protein [Paraburkholderia sp.]MDE1180193.1 carboxypeptidase-like regulatory domain-containing protein [Paraburkholderia sp.]
MNNRLTRRCLATAIATTLTITVLGLAGCGGGNGSTPSSTAVTPIVVAQTLTGTVATGNPVANATVTLTDSTGAQASTTTDANGTYSLSVKGMTAPVLLVATPAGNQSTPLYAILGTLNASTATGVANITTLTTAIVAMLTQSGNPSDLTSATALAKITAKSILVATLTFDEILAGLLTQNGLNPTNFDPTTAAFVANRTGLDAVIDSVSLVQSASGGLSIVSNAAPGTLLALNTKTTATTELATPTIATTYLDALPALLNACATSGTLDTSCSPAIDSTFVDNGSTNLLTAHGLSATTFAGASFSYPKTLEFLTSNGRQLALISLPYTLADGDTGNLVTIAQQLDTPVTLANGTQLAWDLIGNQSLFDATIGSHLIRRTFLDSNAADIDRYESGLEISIPTTSNPSVYSVEVTGPGLASPVWLMPRDAVGNSTLALSTTPLSTAPVSPATTSSNTDLYRWSGVRLTGASYTMPSTSGVYAATSIDTTSVPLYSAYLVTFFDSTGTRIGQSTLINTDAPLSASAGASVAWPTLLPSFEADFLSPTGALTASQYAMSVTWSSLVDGLDVALPVSSVQIQTTPGTATGTTQQVNGFSTGTPNNTTIGQYQTTVYAGLNASGVVSCVNCQFAALTAGASRAVQLRAVRDGIAYYDITNYND